MHEGVVICNNHTIPTFNDLEKKPFEDIVRKGENAGILKINNSWTELFNFQNSFNCHRLELLRTAPSLIHKENTGKRRKCLLRAISPLPTVFSKDSFCRHVKIRACLGKG